MRKRTIWLKSIAFRAEYAVISGSVPFGRLKDTRGLFIEDQFFDAKRRKTYKNASEHHDICIYPVNDVESDAYWFPNSPPVGVMKLLKIKEEL